MVRLRSTPSSEQQRSEAQKETSDSAGHGSKAVNGSVLVARLGGGARKVP